MINELKKAFIGLTIVAVLVYMILTKEIVSFKIIDKISSSKCHFPELMPWDGKTKSLLKPFPKYDKCVKHSPLTYVKDNRLFIDENIAKQYFKSRSRIQYCKFAPVLRSAIKKESYIVGKFKQFNSGMAIIDDVIKVACYNKAGKIMYEYVHILIFRKEKLTEKGAAEKRPNVLIMLFDSMSASSFKRALPKTLDYLKQFDNFHFFNKFHTVGENTLPNLVPMLSGLKSELLLGKEKTPPPFDDFPFIWKDFNEKHYITYFNEDWRNSMFNFKKFGFQQKPMDFWLRHYWLSLYDSKSAKPNNLNSNDHPCYYDVLFHKLGFKWLADFLKEYSYTSTNVSKTDQNLFGIFKSNEMSHDYLERLFWIDDDLKSLLQEMLTESFLDNTLLILMGDHGHRFHSIRHTTNGKLEQKLPALSILLPRKLTKQNPYLNDILNMNTQTLITPYDVHETLRQILVDQYNTNPSNGTYLKDKSERKAKGVITQGYSLFMSVPSRNCKQAGIPESLCSCIKNRHYKVIANDKNIATVASHFLVDYINNVLLKDYSKECAKYELKTLKDLQVFDGKYSIIFETSPNNAIFEGLVTPIDLKNLEIGKRFKVIDKIVRVSLYGNTSSCIDSYDLKNYCYCKLNLT